jgi:hypothetical protein
MGSKETYYIIGVGDVEDWEKGQGAFYYIEDRNGERCLPIFSTPEKAEGYAKANFGQPQAHLSMLESGGPTSSAALTGGRFSLMPVDTEPLAGAAAAVDADYLVRDPRSRPTQETLRLR